MKKIKENIRLLSALIWIAVSVCTLFVSVLSYTAPDGVNRSYAIRDIIHASDFYDEVMRNYTGPVLIEIGDWAVVALCLIAVAAIITSFIGVIILSKQRPTRWPFVMTIAGLIGTALPSLAILAATAVSVDHFRGQIFPGVYPIVTPIAMTICLILVISERRKQMQKQRKAETAQDIIRPAGDL